MSLTGLVDVILWLEEVFDRLQLRRSYGGAIAYNITFGGTESYIDLDGNGSSPLKLMSDKITSYRFQTQEVSARPRRGRAQGRDLEMARAYRTLQARCACIFQQVSCAVQPHAVLPVPQDV